MTPFTPYASLLGGLLIGLSTLICLLFLGKVAGISSIVGQLWQTPSCDRGWRIAFLIGLIVSPWVYRLFNPLPSLQIVTSTPMLVFAGLLVGFGARLGSGCTSGHGVCGLSRGSIRSLAATFTFMAVAMAVVGVMRHIFH